MLLIELVRNNETKLCSRVERCYYVWVQNVGLDARQDAQRRRTRNHACSSAKNVVPSASVCLLVPTATNSIVLATTTGRQSVEAPNALNFLVFLPALKPPLN